MLLSRVSFHPGTGLNVWAVMMRSESTMDKDDEIKSNQVVLTVGHI